MGKNKGFNWKARKIVQVSTDDSHRKKIKIEIEGKNHSFDDANPLVLPSKKRRTFVKKQAVQTTKLLSKKQRKHLEKIVEKKKKKVERAALLESLAKNQVGPEILSKFTPITEMLTKGRKKLFDPKICSSSDVTSDVKKWKVTGGKKIQKFRFNSQPKFSDPNMVGFSSSDSDDTSENEDEGNTEGSIETVSVEFQRQENSIKNRNPEEIDIDSDVDEVSCHVLSAPSVLNSSCAENENIEKPESNDSSEPSIPELSPCKSEKFEKAAPNNPLKSSNSSKCDQNSVEKPKIMNNEKKTFVPVDRIPELQHKRLQLPIIGEEQVIMEAINDNDVVVIVGETGSGKTTQVPQFLYEAGYSLNGKMIGVTEPRRVAAISMSHRVAKELNLTSEEVSYLIRFEGNATSKTQIKFMTDGVLLKEIQKDFLLSQYTAIILDEAHERSAYTDILIGLLSRITPLRRKKNNPLKLIIMSATLRLSDFTENERLFSIPPPVIKVDARQYSVTVHHNRRTAVDYVGEAFKKATKIHTQLPDGGILIFLTGQQEVNNLVRKLRRTFPLRRDKAKTDDKNSLLKLENKIKKELLEKEEESNDVIQLNEDDETDFKMNSKKVKQKLRKIAKNSLPQINIDDYDIQPADDELYETDDDELDADFIDESLINGKQFPSLWVLPLYSLLSSKEQAKVFEPPPEGCRLCVVSTNVAETSITIPHVKYVIDCGRTKLRLYDKLTGMSEFIVTWTSKASANQRAGRAGRTSDGHCYRLYSSAVFNDQFEEWDVPEIQRKPVDDLVLQMKAMKIDRVVNFPFPSPPDITQLKMAEKRLTLLGALNAPITLKDEWNSKLTALGEAMAVFPIAPRFSKMLCLSQQHNLLPYTVVIVAALSVREFLLDSNEQTQKIWRTWVGSGNSLLLGDVMVLLRALGAAEYANTNGEGIEKFCSKCGFRYKAVIEARKLRVQLTNLLNLRIPSLNLGVDPRMSPPTDEQARQLRQIMLCGMADQVACRLSEGELRQAGLSVNKLAYRVPELEDIIFLKSSTVLKRIKPTWIIYQEVYQSRDKLYARGITAIEPEWLPLYANTLCNISEPLKDPAPCYDEISGRVMCYVSSTFGRRGWQLPLVKTEYPLSEERYRWFALFFLQGDIFPKLKIYTAHYLSPPIVFLKSWAKFLQGRTNNMLKKLIDLEVGSREKVIEQWKENPNYLLDSYLEWLPPSMHKQVKSSWPPTDN